MEKRRGQEREGWRKTMTLKVKQDFPSSQDFNQKKKKVSNPLL